MANFKSKDVKKIKKALVFLNKEHGVNFVAWHPQGTTKATGENRWWIYCDNMIVYMSPDPDKKEDFNLSKEAIYIKFPKLGIVFAFQHNITTSIKEKDGVTVRV